MKGRGILSLAVAASGCAGLREKMGDDLAASFTRQTVAAIAIATLGMGVLGLALPFTLVQVYDRIIAYRSEATLVWLFGGCAVAIVLEAVLSASRSRLTAWASARVATRYEVRAVRSLLSAAEDSDTELKPGALLERLGAGRVAAGFVAQSLIALFEAPFVLVYLGTLAVMGRNLYLVPMLALGLQLVVLLLAAPRSAEDHHHLAEFERERIEDITRGMVGIGFVKALALEPFLATRFERIQTHQADASFAVLRRERVMQEYLRFLSTAATFALLAVGAGEVARGGLTIGALSTAVLLAGRAIGAAQGPLRLVLRSEEAGNAVREVQQALVVPGVEGARGRPLPAGADSRLEFSEVSFGSGSPSACSEISFVLRPGEGLALEDDGSRWTSLFCLAAAGLKRPENGRVHLDIYPLDAWDASTGGLVAHVPPRSDLLPGTLLENLTGFFPPLRDAALDAASILGLDKAVSRLPRGYDTQVDPRTEILPSSVVQRLHVARAIARRPRLLVWDHADGMIDAEGRAIVLEVLGRLAGSTTFVIASARPEFRGTCRWLAKRVGGHLVMEARG